MRRVSLGLPLLAVMSLTGPSPTFADVVLPDPLAGYCAGAEQCVHGSVDAPTSTNPPVDFGFTASGGPSTGDLLIDILIPTTLDPGGNYTLTGTLSGTASLVSTTPFAAGAFGLGSNPTLSAYLDAVPKVPDPHPLSPDNNLMNYLGSTQPLVPSETGYDVYQVDLGSATLQKPGNPGISPLEELTGQSLQLGFFIVAFQNQGTAASPDWVGTENSGAIFETSSCSSCGDQPVPEPASVAILGSGLVLLGLLVWFRRRSVAFGGPATA